MSYIFQCQLTTHIGFKANITYPYNLWVSKISHLNCAKVSNSIINKQIQVRSSIVGGYNVYNLLKSLFIYMQALIWDHKKFIPIGYRVKINLTYGYIKPREEWGEVNRCFLKQLVMVSHKCPQFPCFTFMNWSLNLTNKHTNHKQQWMHQYSQTNFSMQVTCKWDNNLQT